MTDALADYLQVWGFEGDFLIFSDGSYGFGLDVTPLDVSCWEEDRINTLAKRLVEFLNGLPAGTDIQFVQDIGAGNDGVVSSHAELGDRAENEIARALCQERVEALNDADTRGLIPFHGLKLFVRRPPSQSLLSKRSIFSSSKTFVAIAEDKLRAEIALTEHLRNQVLHGLGAMELNAKSLSSDHVADLMYGQWNPGRPIDRPKFDPEDVRTSLLFSDLTTSERGFSIGGVHHRVLSLKLLPDETFASMAAALRELPFNSRVHLSIHVPDQQQEITSLQTQRRLAFSMARGKQSGVSDIDSEAKLTDLESLLAEMIARGEMVFHASLNIILRSADPFELENQVALALMKMRELGGAEAMEESLAAADIFVELSIPNARAKERAKRLKTSNLVDLLPIYGPWKGHDRASVMLRSRMGNLVSFDPFSKTFSNYNHVISGGSGSGKSFLTNLLLLQMLKENPRIFIVDIGGSYRRLCENLAGQNVTVGADTTVSINPFDLGPADTVPSSSKIKFLLGLVELMTKEEGVSRLPRLERAELEEAIQRVYDTQREPRVSTLREILLGHESPEMKRFGKILAPWCGDTPFGRIVDRPTTIALSRPLVAFDLKGMEAYPDLQAVTLFVITDYVWRDIQKDRSTPKFLIFDECWKLLENEAGASFIGEVFRTFRKYYASAIAISQNIDDFAKSKVSAAILSNSAIKWLLMQKGADQNRLKEVLQLNDAEMRLIASLHQERGTYSEAFLIADSDRSVVALEPTPLEYWIATTDPRDLAKLEECLRKEPQTSQFLLLKELSKKHPRGVAASK